MPLQKYSHKCLALRHRFLAQLKNLHATCEFYKLLGSSNTWIFSHVSLKLQLKNTAVGAASRCICNFFYFLCHRIASSAPTTPSLLSTACASVLLSPSPALPLSCLLSACLAIFQLLSACSRLMSAGSDNNNSSNISSLQMAQFGLHETYSEACLEIKKFTRYAKVLITLHSSLLITICPYCIY